MDDRIKEIVGEFAQELYRSRVWQIEQMRIGAKVEPPYATAEQLLQSGEAQEWVIMARAALGELENIEDNRLYVYEICQGLAEWLFAVPGSGTYGIPASWWETEMGALHMAALVWAQGDELITQAAAAELKGVSVQAINNAIRDGRLRGYQNPDAANPRKGGTLVSKKEIEEM